MIIRRYLLNRILIILFFGVLQSCGEPNLNGRCFEFQKNKIKENVCFLNADSALYEVFVDNKLVYKSICSYYFHKKLHIVEVNRDKLNDEVRKIQRENEYLCVGRLLGSVENLNSIFFKTYIYRHNKIEVDCSLIEVDN